jgi:hypothetical protein
MCAHPPRMQCAGLFPRGLAQTVTPTFLRGEPQTGNGCPRQLHEGWNPLVQHWFPKAHIDTFPTIQQGEVVWRPASFHSVEQIVDDVPKEADKSLNSLGSESRPNLRILV